MKQTDVHDAATKKDLVEFADRIVSQLRIEMDTREKSMKKYIDRRLSERLHQQEVSLKAHTEDVVGHHSSEILQAIADVVEPMQKQLQSRTRRISA